MFIYKASRGNKVDELNIKYALLSSEMSVWLYTLKERRYAMEKFPKFGEKQKNLRL